MNFFDSLHMEVKELLVEDKTHLEYAYKIKSNITNVKNYGLAIARFVRLPVSLLERAEEVVELIQDETMLMNLSRKERSSNTSRNESENTTMRNRNETSHRTDMTANQTIISEEMPLYEKDIVEIFSLVLILMSRVDITQPNSDSKIVLNKINKRLEMLIEKMSPELKAMIQQSTLNVIISALNATKSSE